MTMSLQLSTKTIRGAMPVFIRLPKFTSEKRDCKHPIKPIMRCLLKFIAIIKFALGCALKMSDVEIARHCY